MSHQGALYLERTDTVAARLDNIVDTTFEPVVAVLIAPCHIACVVDAIVPCLAGLLLIAIVTLEQTDRLLVAYADYNLSLFTILAAGAIGTQQIDVVLSVRDTHTAWFGCHPGEGAKGHGSLGLTEALHHLYACLLLELVEYSRVKCLACGTAVLKAAEIVLAQVLANHETIDGRRCAE